MQKLFSQWETPHVSVDDRSVEPKGRRRTVTLTAADTENNNNYFAEFCDKTPPTSKHGWSTSSSSEGRRGKEKGRWECFCCCFVHRTCKILADAAELDNAKLRVASQKLKKDREVTIVKCNRLLTRLLWAEWNCAKSIARKVWLIFVLNLKWLI